MNKNKVFLLVEKWQFHGDGNSLIEVYGTYEKAKEKFNKIIKEEKEHLNNKDEEQLQEYCIEKYEDYFSYYKDGFYTEENYTLQIEKREII